MAGVDEVMRNARRREQTADHVIGTELGPPGQVLVGGGMAGQVEKRRADRPHAQAGVGVEQRTMQGAGPVGLGEQCLELSPIQLVADQTVTMMVDERDARE